MFRFVKSISPAGICGLQLIPQLRDLLRPLRDHLRLHGFHRRREIAVVHADDAVHLALAEEPAERAVQVECLVLQRHSRDVVVLKSVADVRGPAGQIRRAGQAVPEEGLIGEEAENEDDNQE